MSGDYQLEDTVYLPFTTRAFATGIPTALVSGEVQIYEDASVTQITAAETLTVSLDSIAGFNMCSVAATAANGFGTGQSYTAILSAGTVDSVSAIGEVVGQFTIEMGAAYLNSVVIASDLILVHSETTAILVDTGTTLSAQVTTIASDLVLIYSDTTAIHSETTAILVDTGTTLSAQVTTIASDVVLIYSDTTAIEVDTSTTLSAQITTIASDVVIAGSDTAAIEALAAGAEGFSAIAFDVDAINGRTILTDAAIILVTGVADSGTTTTAVDAARTEGDTDYWVGDRIQFLSGTIAGQVREITGFNFTTDTITFSPATTQAVGTNQYNIISGVAASGLTASQASDLVAIESELILVHSETTALQTQATTIASDVVVIDNAVSDIESSLVIVKSDLVVITSDTTAVESELIVVHSDTTAIHSDTTIIHSDTVIISSDTAVIEAAGASTGPQIMVTTTIATLATQVSFTLTAGSADNNAYLNQMVIVTDAATSTQKAVGLVSAYTGATKTVTLDTDPAIFTMAAGDNVAVIAVAVSDAVIEVDASGRVDVGSVLGTAQTAGDLAALITTVDTVVDGIQTDLDNGTDGLGTIKTVIDAIEVDTINIEAAIGVVDTNVDQIETAVITNAAGVDIAADIIALKAETALIVADTNELQTDDVPTLISTLDAVVDTVKAETALIVADTNELQADDYPTSIAALQTDLDTLTNARSEPAQGAPGVSETTNTKIDWLYKAWRNKSEQTSTTYSLYNDAGSVVDSKATVSDNGTTAAKGEVATGP